MRALFIGHSYIDVTFITDVIPTGDDKALGKDYAFGVGGNAMVAGFTCAKLGVQPDMLMPIAEDWLGEMLLQRCQRFGITVHPRRVKKSSLSLILPNDGKRAVVRCRDDAYLEPFAQLSLDGLQAMHTDGHQPDASLYYAKACRERGILTSLDGGAVRPTTAELLPYIDIAVVSERFAQQLGKSPTDTIAWLQTFDCKVSAITLGDKGIYYALGKGPVQHMPALTVPVSAVVDSTGAGDIFHGAYIFSYVQDPTKPWAEHFAFARAASALSVQRLGTENSIPTYAEVTALMSA